MTAAGVTQVSPVSGNIPLNTGKTVQPADDFSELLKNQTAKTVQNGKTSGGQVKNQDKAGVEKTENRQDWNAGKTGKKENVSCKEVSQSGKTEEPDELSSEDLEAAMVAITEMVNAICKELQVSPEEVQEALNELNLLPEDIFSQDAISKLVVALTEGADELSLMTDEAVFQKAENLKGAAADILKQLSEKLEKPAEEIKSLLAKATEAEEPADADAVVRVDTSDEKEFTQDRQMVRTAGLEKTDTVPVTVKNQKNASDTAKHGDSDGKNRNSAMTDGTQNHLSAAQKVFDEVKAAVAKTDGGFSNVSTAESILNQIKDGIRVIQKQDLTEMELQLHPASLGRVKVQLTSREGLVTANFTAENAAVKAALESQITVLRQNFEQQGIKVEAVEVTVASHAFEENLSDSSEESSGGEMEQKKTHRRKLSLNEIMNADTMDELPEEERVVADMMMKNGNSVDYLA